MQEHIIYFTPTCDVFLNYAVHLLYNSLKFRTLAEHQNLLGFEELCRDIRER